MRHPRKRNVHTSRYPEMDAIDNASHRQLGYWVRYLNSPGVDSYGADNFADVLAMESAALDLIMERFDSLGGWTPKVSKAVDKLHDAKEAA